MSVDEELQEHAEHAKEPFDKKVAVTMAIIAAMLAVDGVMAHLLTTEELLLQQKASDQWSYYQAKNIRWHEMQANADLLGALAPSDKEKTEALREKYVKQAEKYEADKDEISNEAKKLEGERDVYGQRENRFDAGEALLEIGLVICSMTLLTKKKFFWFSGMAIAAVGVAIAVTGFLLH